MRHGGSVVGAAYQGHEANAALLRMWWPWRRVMKGREHMLMTRGNRRVMRTWPRPLRCGEGLGGHQGVMAEHEQDQHETQERPSPPPGLPGSTVLSHQRLQPEARTFYAGRGSGATLSGRRSSRRSNCALSATTMVETLIRTAPTAGGSTKPTEARMPAASGMARML